MFCWTLSCSLKQFRVDDTIARLWTSHLFTKARARAFTIWIYTHNTRSQWLRRVNVNARTLASQTRYNGWFTLSTQLYVLPLVCWHRFNLITRMTLEKYESYPTVMGVWRKKGWGKVPSRYWEYVLQFKTRFPIYLQHFPTSWERCKMEYGGLCGVTSWAFFYVWR